MSKKAEKISKKSTVKSKISGTNGKSSTADLSQPDANDSDKTSTQLDPEMIAKISELRSKVHETFGKVTLAMMALPRYRHMSVQDLGTILLDPMMSDRIAIASPQPAEGAAPEIENLAGIAIWASVSEDVDIKIREQIKSGVFPVRLKQDEWNSGSINWLLDVIASNQKSTASVIANFKQVVKEGDLRIHPLVTRLVDPEVLKKMGASQTNLSKKEKAEETV